MRVVISWTTCKKFNVIRSSALLKIQRRFKVKRLCLTYSIIIKAGVVTYGVGVQNNSVKGDNRHVIIFSVFKYVNQCRRINRANYHTFRFMLERFFNKLLLFFNGSGTFHVNSKSVFLKITFKRFCVTLPTWRSIRKTYCDIFSVSICTTAATCKRGGKY